MATLADLEAALDSLLNHPLGMGYYQLVRVVEEKAYEAYIFGLCLQAVRNLGAVPILRGISGLPNPFIFRGAPGLIYSTSRNYGFAFFTLGSQRFEIHAGVEFCGTSSMTHEIDVGILRAPDAEDCRMHRNSPGAACLIAGWECKFYAGNLDKGLGRAFVGLMDDMGNNTRLSGMCSNAAHVQLRDYFKPQRRPYPHFNLTPLDTSNENIFVNQLMGELKKMTGV